MRPAEKEQRVAVCIELTCHVAVLLRRDMVAHHLRVRVARRQHLDAVDTIIPLSRGENAQGNQGW